ncbi:RidA family protein [Pseudomonas sp. 148P]|uniref:RidA family protein n=1 Tax=Pseudomonas ulcerans TaxID=3115852 RepID=A0ABU7HVQ1_9PSED|nr:MULTISPECIES: RidA family protein [unclassified Pseudomonas]MEE1924150.1 RidA family protein [Pseudomonas sp. 147P]MEE1935523.1 RidA family protein [Pseudomonas sp. 148P]
MSDIERYGFDTRIHHGVKHNGVVYLTGQVGTPGTSAAAQTREVLGKIDELLAQAGTDKRRILNVMLWLDDLRDFDEVNQVWDTWVDKAHAPARSTGQARMTRPGMLVEIIVTAAT